MKKLNKKRMTLLTACVISAIANAGFAAEADIDAYEGTDYVVTATRTPLEKKEVPQSVEVITKEEIQNLGAITVQDALRTATNFNIVQSTGANTKLSLRGGASSDILILLNGRRIPGEGSGGTVQGNTYVLQRLNVANIERIEILRGPAGALYGSEAKDGVINIITRKSEKASTTVGVATGSNTMSNYYHFDSGKQGKVSAVLDANFAKDRYFKLTDKAEMTKYYGPKQNYSLDMDYELDTDHKLNLYMDYEKAKQSADYFNKATGFFKYNSPYQIDRRSTALTYTGKDGKNNYMVSANYGILKKDSGSGMGSGLRHQEYESWQFEARDTVDVDANNRLTFGAEYKNEGRKDSSMNKKNHQYSYFVHDEMRVGDKLLVIPAVRLDRHDEFGSKTSPNLGVTYSFTDNSRFKANYGKGFRAPSAGEMYLAVMGNPNLKPETSEGYEFSYEQEWDKTSAKVTYFNSDKKDAIKMQILGFGSYKYVNVAEAKDEGVEFELKQDLTNGFTLTANYDWLNSVDKTTGSRNNYDAKNTYMLRLSWADPAESGWSVEAWNKWQSKYRFDNTDYGINTFNFVVNKRWGEKYRAFFGLDNVFDKEYADIYYSGRMWRVGAEMTF